MGLLTAAYLFLLGAASGLVVLTLSVYRRISPSWLKRFLLATGLLLISRYVTMAFFTLPDAPQRFWWAHRLWLASTIGLTLPAIFVIDQLLRHPALSPKKLLVWASPLVVINGAVMLFGSFQAVPDPVAGWTLRVGEGWRLVLAVTQGIFVAALLGWCGLLIWKFPSRPVRQALGLLIASYAYLGVDGVLLAVGGWYFRPFLYSELAALLALWYAYDTAVRA